MENLLLILCLFSAFVPKLLSSEEVSDDKTEAAASTRSEAAADVCERDRETYQPSHMNKTGVNKLWCLNCFTSLIMMCVES